MCESNETRSNIQGIENKREDDVFTHDSRRKNTKAFFDKWTMINFAMNKRNSTNLIS